MAAPSALTIAGLDPGGGAGIAADLAVFAAFRCHGMAVAAALTVQDSGGVRCVRAVESAFVADELTALLDDCPPAAAKTGMLGGAATVAAIAGVWRLGTRPPLVVDPLVRSGSGIELADPAASRAAAELLFPLAALVTPNAIEAESLTGIGARDAAGAEAAGRRILEMGARAVLVKGGHASGELSVDVLVERGLREATRFERKRIATPRRVHGTGCALSAAIAAALARGSTLRDAIDVAGRYVHAAIAGAYPIGPGALVLDFSVRVSGMAA